MTNRFTLYAAGILCLLGGILALFNPLAASLTAEQIAGWLFLISGGIQIVAAFREGHGARSWLTGLLGGLGLLVGLSLLLRPMAGIIALGWLVAVFFLTSGIVKLMLSWRLRGTSLFALVLGSGIVSAALGLLIIAYMPGSAILTLGAMLAVDLLSSGVALIALGRATANQK